MTVICLEHQLFLTENSFQILSRWPKSGIRPSCTCVRHLWKSLEKSLTVAITGVHNAFLLEFVLEIP